MKVMSVIGIVKYLEQKDRMKYIKTFVGTSAGSIISLLLALGFNSDELKKIVMESLQDKSVTNFEPEGLFDLFSTYGISDGENMEILFNKLIYKKYKTNNITFLDFAKLTGKNLVICVSNLTKERYEFFCVDNTPSISVAKAVRISCTIPIMFQPVIIQDQIYLDGGLFNNFPINYFQDNKLRDILGINILIKNYQKSDNFLQYLKFIFNSVVTKFCQQSINSEDRNIMTLEFEDDDGWFTFSEIKISLSLDKLEKYIEMGYNSALEKNI